MAEKKELKGKGESKKKEAKEKESKHARKEAKQQAKKTEGKKEIKKQEKKPEVKKEIKIKKPELKKSEPKPLKPIKMEKGTPKEIILAYEIIKHPLITEKAVGFIESENKLSFIVSREATKAEIKNAVEKLFAVKVEKVNVLKDMKNRKKAFVRISKQFKASDVATKLGVL